MRKVTIETILDHYNKKTEEVYEAERNELIQLSFQSMSSTLDIVTAVLKR